MTIAQLLDVVAVGDWHLDEYGCLSDDNDDCPLWHAYRELDPDEDGDAGDVLEAGVRIGLRKSSAMRIVHAADNRGESKLRRRLLMAVGVSEPNPTKQR